MTRVNARQTQKSTVTERTADAARSSKFAAERATRRARVLAAMRDISPEDRSRIRALLTAGWSTRKVAGEFNIAQSSVWRISHEVEGAAAPDGAQVRVSSSVGDEFFATDKEAEDRYTELLRQGVQASVWRRANVELGAKIK